MSEPFIERDMPECEAYNMEPTFREEDEISIQEIAETEKWQDYEREAKWGMI